MERVVGEVFNFDEVKLQVKDIGNSLSCCGCYFFKLERTCDTMDRKKQVGACVRAERTDNKNVIFVEVKQ